MSVLEKINAMAKNVSEKATDAIETTKLNNKIAEENRKIVDYKREIGEAIWQKFELGEEVPAEVKEFCENIEACKMAIDESSMEVQKIKDEQGITEEEPAEALAKVMCPVCGSENIEGTKFCGECGAKL